MECKRNGGPFEYGVPRHPKKLLRLVTSENYGPADFLREDQWRSRRPTEDYAGFRAFSAWEDLEIAKARMQTLNEKRAKEGDPPYTHIVEFELSPKKRHACALTDPEQGHWNVWADFAEFLSFRVVYPTESEEA